MSDKYEALRKWAIDRREFDKYGSGPIPDVGKQILELLAERDALEVQRDNWIEAATDAAHRYWKLMEEKNRYREALEFYAGQTQDAVWDGSSLMTFDKFGGLDEFSSGPMVARDALKDAEPRDEGK